MGGEGVFRKCNISTKEARRAGFEVYMSRTMAGDHVT